MVDSVVAGQPILAAWGNDVADELNALAAAAPLQALKATSSSRTSTSPTADPALAISLPAGKTFAVEAFTVWTGAAPNVTVNCTAQAVYRMLVAGPADSGLAGAEYPLSSPTAPNWPTPGATAILVRFLGAIVTADADTLAVRWASDTGSSCTLERGSWLRAIALD